MTDTLTHQLYTWSGPWWSIFALSSLSYPARRFLSGYFSVESVERCDWTSALDNKGADAAGESYQSRV